MWQVAAADQYLRLGDQSRGVSGTNSSGTGIARIGRASVGLGAREISSRVDGAEALAVDWLPCGGLFAGPPRWSSSSSRCAIISTWRLSSGDSVETGAVSGI